MVKVSILNGHNSQKAVRKLQYNLAVLLCGSIMKLFFRRLIFSLTIINLRANIIASKER